ncbi:lipoate--protein ligase [Spirochaeta africana]|uniref:Lipoate-protein ligase A n=1 Tax=Spirochaeta africana (strain ATCC 700263 / DSM 8902 / Z-7692) TaxID=889378 RepID=H9UMY9_SPIAZ|nr:lipoate--protein ligase [Spirochaeta africana]AFG38882.1 lipoate-protein ligase A [Spirochaeta africana DSM 8902]
MEMIQRAFVSSSLNPFENLAFEDWLYRTLPVQPDGSAAEIRVLFYRNDPCVVIGRHQNPWKECALGSMLSAGIPLVRRQSGGGAVYHDAGNINWSIMVPRQHYDPDHNFTCVLTGLHGLGIPAERNERSDLLVQGRKVSGSAFKVGRDRCIHHGTLLLHADLDDLLRYLTARDRGLMSKGIDSVRSRVANLQEYAPDLGNEELISSVAQGFGVDPETIVQLQPDLQARDTLAYECFTRLQEWDWRYGKTPDFRHSFFVGDQQMVELDVHRGRIRQVLADGLPPETGQRLQQQLQSVRYRRQDILHLAGHSGSRMLETILKRIAQEIEIYDYQS